MDKPNLDNKIASFLISLENFVRVVTTQITPHNVLVLAIDKGEEKNFHKILAYM